MAAWTVSAPDHASFVRTTVRTVGLLSIDCLDLTSKQLTGTDIRLILHAVKTPGSVTSLLLGNNSLLGAEGAAAVGEFLAESPSLTSLDLRGTLIGDEGLAHILKGLDSNISLTNLDLRRNKFNGASAVQIRDFIRENATISKIDLRHNAIGEPGADAIVDAVKAGHATADIFMEATKDQVQRLEAALEKNRNRPMVLTLRWSPPIGGALRFVCSTMGGRELAGIEAHVSDKLGDFRARVAKTVGVNATNVVLILPDARMLEDASGTLKLEELLGS